MNGNPFDRFDSGDKERTVSAGATPFDKFDAPKERKLGELAQQVPGTPPQPKYTPPGMLERYVTGPAEAALSVGTGLLAAPVGAAAGLYRGLTGGKYGTPAGALEAEQRMGEVQQQFTRQPRTAGGREALESVGKAISATKLEGLPPAETMAAASIARPSMQVAKEAAGKMAAPVGKALAPEMEAIGALGRRVGAAVRPQLDPQVVDLARKAEAMGIRIPPDKLSDNKFLRLMGQASREVPLSGAGTEENRIAFNRAIIKAFGGDVREPRLTSKVYSEAMNRHGGTIDEISSSYKIPLDPDFDNKVKNIGFNASQFETADVAKIVNNYTAEIEKLGTVYRQGAVPKGEIDGAAFRKLRTKLTGQMRRTSNGDLKHALSELDDAMLDQVQKQLSAGDLLKFNEARRFYANGKTIEPLVAKAETKGLGHVSPAALAGRVTSTAGGKGAAARGKAGELAEISAVGSRFLPEPSSSLTAERGLAYSILGGGGLAGGVPGAAGIYGAANIYNRLGPWLSRQMLPPPPIEPRAEGGPVEEGKPYLVGERGPEVIVPQQGGTVIPNRDLSDPRPMYQPLNLQNVQPGVDMPWSVWWNAITDPRRASMFSTAHMSRPVTGQIRPMGTQMPPAYMPAQNLGVPVIPPGSQWSQLP